MSRVVARVASLAGSSASDGFSSDEEWPGQFNMWCPLLETAHHSIGAFLALGMFHSSKAALSQSCHFALFVNLVARSSTDEFFHVVRRALGARTHFAGSILAAQA